MSGDTLELLARIHAADRAAVDRVGEQLPAVARAADAIAERLRRGGRWFYLGAGTSGRVAAQDAAELPPTFGTDPGRVRALIAGGREALLVAVEGAEDDAGAAAAALAEAELSAADAVVGVAASGATPYVLGGVRFARQRGALAIGFSCARASPLAAAAELAIEIDVGPEVIAGSTRMKAGTAQKLALTMLSTAVMHRLGLVVRGEMVAMQPTNAKLRLRAERIVRDLLEVDAARARALLDQAAWSLPVALVAGRHGIATAAARAHLAASGGDVARALAAGPPA